MIPIRRILFAAATLALWGCDWGRCIYEIRSLQADGQVIGPGSESISAHITLSEQRDSDPSKDMYWAISSPDLKGHVTSAELKDGADLSRVVLSLPIAPADRPLISENAVSTRQGENLSAYWDMFSANRAVIEIRTDLPSRPLITIPLTVTDKQNWTRPYCS